MGEEPGIRRAQIRQLVMLAGTAFGLYLGYLLALPFLPALTWALVLSILLAPAHQRLEAHVRPRNLAAFISVVAAAVVIIVPAIFIVQQLAREVARGAIYMTNILQATEWRETVNASPRLSAIAAWVEERLDLAGVASGLVARLSTLSTTLLRGSVNQVINLILTFYLLFYFLRDREPGLRALKNLSPLSEIETEEVARRFVDTVHATIFGTVAVASVQGALGGLIFSWLGLPTPVFWGVVMGLLAIVPVLGAFIVWVPAALFLALEGEWVKALVLAGWGGVIVATIDNLLYPILVGDRLRLHTVVAFVGAVGGIILFGASGLILGPAIIAVTVTLVWIMKTRWYT